MVPVKLKMQAFLPFNDEQVIDFNVIENDKIFLITGNTGAGKTAIFDAVFFALYGHASGSQRESDSFKSKFSDDSVTSYVEFTFKSNGKIYTVYRTPVQTKLRRNGNLSLENATASITLENGEIISGVRNTDEYIEQIIGLNAEQFKKIVMLPQGEFRRFLSDNSNEKQEILRKIFSTYIFEEFTQKLKDKNAVLSEKAANADNSRNSYCKSIIAPTDSTLFEELSKESKNYDKIALLCEQYISLLNEKSDEYNSKITSLTEEKFSIDIPKLKETNEKLSFLKNVKEQYLKLSEQKAEFEKKREELFLLEHLKEIYIVYQSLNDTERKLENEVKKQPVLQKDHHLAQASYDEKLKLFNSIADITKEISRLNSMSEIFNDLNVQTKKLEEINLDIATAKKYYEAFNTRKENEAVNEALLLISSLKKAFFNRKKYTQTFTNASESYKNAFNTFIANQAYNLASTLKADMPCPVCGSTSHPNPASNKLSAHIDEQTLKDLKKAYEESVTSLQDIKDSISSIIFKLNEYTPLNEDISEDDIDLLMEKFTLKLRTEDDKLPKNELYDSLDSDGFIELLNKLNANKESTKEVINTLNEHISGYEFNKSQLAKQIASKSELIEKIKSDFNDANVKLQEVKSSLESNKQAINQLSLLKDELGKKSEQMLTEYCIDKTKLSDMFVKLDSIDRIKEEVNAYNSAVIRCEEQIKAYSYELDGKQFTDISKSEQRLKKVNELLDELKQKYEHNLTVISTNSKMLENIKRINGEFKELSDSYNQINQLYQIANGKNKDKISFERYVLGAYFDSVIENANIRLTKITDGRYYLRRRTDKERGNSPSGLDLEIFDSYNGKFRHVNTLSGGESFKTALCLALGLADTVTQNSGGIEINTIFIDEGFGTLDSDALDSAIECLYSIKASGRYIGVISHVTELSEKIPLKLYVSQGKSGSFASFKES